MPDETHNSQILRVHVAIASFVTLLALTIAGTAFVLRFDQTNKFKEEAQIAQVNQNKAIRSILCLAENIVVNNPSISPKEKRASIAFYNRALVLIKQPPCTNQGG